MTELGFYASSYISLLPTNRPAFEYVYSVMIHTSATTSEGEITISMRLENLTKKDLVITCGRTRGVV